MTERERWIVYPLLFLALGASLRDKLVDRTTTKSIVCQELLVIDEQPLGREPILLAKIGRSEPVSSSVPPACQIVVNGELEIVDRDPIAHQLVRTLVRVGRTDSTKGSAPIGLVSVNGAINAAQYAYQGVPFAPALQAVFPSVSLPEMLRALQATQQQQKEATTPSQPPKEDTDEQPPQTAPLAEPEENR